jgi:hypothetical protein
MTVKALSLSLTCKKHISFGSGHLQQPIFIFTGAKKAREVVFSVLRDACIDGDLSISEAVEAAKDIFAHNAIQFYKINLSLGLKNTSTPYPVKMKTSALDNDVSLVRIIWVDGSGQHRCRVSTFFPL